jgi:hypothetical protein
MQLAAVWSLPLPGGSGGPPSIVNAALRPEALPTHVSLLVHSWHTNKFEHRLFSFISQNWRGKPLISYQSATELLITADCGGSPPYTTPFYKAWGWVRFDVYAW